MCLKLHIPAAVTNFDIFHQKSKETHKNVRLEHGSGVSSLEPRSENENSIITKQLLIGAFNNRGGNSDT